jgi:hypothetical protein
VRNRSGVGTGEIWGFLALLGIAVATGIYMEKPNEVIRTVVVQAPPTAPPPSALAPVVTPPASEVRAPVTPPPPLPQLPEAVAIFTPPAPACMAIEKRLRIAQQAAIQANIDVATAKQSALDMLRQSPDYQSMKADLDDKKRAKEDALNAFQKDDSAGNDTDQDTLNIRAASVSWVNQLGVIAKLENETVANDEMLQRKVQDLKDIKIDILDQQKQLGNYINKEIKSVCDRTACEINDVKLDADHWIIEVDMTPVAQGSPGEMADAALNNIGAILETVSKSPFTWQGIRFRVRDEISNTVQYQLTFTHNATADVNFEQIHINSLLSHPIHTVDLEIGTTGILFDVKIMNIVDENNMIVWLDESDQNIDDLLRPVWIRGIDTAGKVDESNLDITTPLRVTGTIRYTTVEGGSKTVFLLEPTGFKQNIVIGDYYDDSKLISLAQNIWLNPTIDRLQGRQPLPDSYIRQPGMTPPEFVNTLRIGGYIRSDGSICPITLVHSPHPVWAAQPEPPRNRTPSLPSYGNNSNPLITNGPPPQGF